MSYGYSARSDGHGGVVLTPNRELQRVIDRALRRRRTRDADDPRDPNTAESDYLQHGEFLPGGQPSDRTTSTVRNVIFHYPPAEPRQSVELVKNPDGSVDVVLVTPAADLTGETRDRVHRLSGVDPVLQRWNKINRAHYADHSSAIEQRPKYKPGTEPDRIRQVQEANRRFWG